MSDATQKLVVLQIQGMTCEGCVQTVRQALLATPGVTDAEVSLDSKQAVISGQATPAALQAAVRQAGYSASS